MAGNKDILIVNPWIYDFTAYDFWMKPLGLLQIAAVLESYTPYRLHFIDCLDRFSPDSGGRSKSKTDGRGPFLKTEVVKPDILKPVPRRYSRYGMTFDRFDFLLASLPVPDAVLLTCGMTYWYPGIQVVIERIRKRFGQVPIILGGIYATLAPDHARQESGADFICQGLGENRILPLLAEILEDSSLSFPRLNSLQDLPPPAFRLLSNHETLPVLSSRGCPFSCSYCAGPLLFPGFEQLSPRITAERIFFWEQALGVRHFAFYDDALFVHKEKHIIPLLKELIRREVKAAFHTPNGVHIREIDSQLARLLKRANFQSLFLSQESFDQDWLGRTGRKFASGDLERAIAELREAGYRRDQLNVYLLAGGPDQKSAAIRDSIRQVLRLGGRPRLAFYSPVPGTRDWEDLVKQGVIPRNADPLLHNKLTFPYIWGNIDADEFECWNRLLREHPE